MFKTLRAKLILTYAVVVVLCLVLAGSAAVYLFNDYQEQTARRNMRLLVIALASQMRGLAVQRAPIRETTQRLQAMANEVGARLLVLDAEGGIIIDSEADAGTDFQVPIPPPTDEPPARGRIGRFVDASGREYYYVTAGVPRPEPLPPDAVHHLALALPVRQVRGAWRELAMPLLAIGGAVFVLATLLGGFLARSVSRPIRQMTQATEAMAQGDYAQEIEVRGDDEVARLARSFNTMAQEVDRAHRMQRDFVANVSHDLKTPLTSIQGFAQALLDGTVEDSGSRRRAAQVIYQEAERMRRLVQALLELAKLESGQIQLDQESVDVGALLAEAVERVKPLAEAGEVEIHLRAPETLPAVRGDEARLSQVFNNLLDNAVSHTPAGGSVAVEAAPTSEGTLEVVISDTGHGIPPDDLPRIFERFYQVDKARAGDRGADPSGLGQDTEQAPLRIGLGLSIVQEVVAAHGGRVTAASQAGQGTRFTVSLPVDHSVSDAA